MTLVRHGKILTRQDIPDVPPEIVDATSVFNPGAVKVGDEILLLLRVQTRGRRTHLMVARSRDGVSFDVEPRIVRIEGIDVVEEEVFHVYDPRITRNGDEFLIVVAMDVPGACRLGTLRTRDFGSLDLIEVNTAEDQRNGVLFPEKVVGRYLRLERPNLPAPPGEPWSGAAIRLSESDDLRAWRPVGEVMRGRPHTWDELIGSGPPPVKTREGWLHLYHGIALHFMAANIYQAGAVLLDLEDPTVVLARTRDNILEPREPWELTGQVPNVVFPSGMIVEETDDEGVALPESRVLVYYGAADTCVGLATATVADLIAACTRE